MTTATSNHFKLLLLAFGLFFLPSCEKGLVNSNQEDSRLSFELLSPETTNIKFKNDVVDSQTANALVFETFYNGGGVGLGDFDNDGLIDIYFCGNQVADKLYKNKGDLKFEDVTANVGIQQKGGWSTGVSIADINNDGWLDIYVCKSLLDDPNLRKNELYINQKNGEFIEQAADYGLDDIWRSQQASFFDYDRDGDLDLFLVNQPPNPGPLSPLKGLDWRDPALGCRFLENTGNHFVDKTKESGLSHGGYPLSASIGDFNNDGWQDIYVAHDYNSPDAFFINSKNKTFNNEIHESFDHISFFAMGSDFGDLNNDGWQDLIVLDMVADDHFRNKANMGGMDATSFWELVKKKGHYQYMFNTLQLNQGVGPDQKMKFGDIAQLANLSNTDWSWSPLIADFDNDGNQDIFISNGIKHDLRYTDGLSVIKAKIAETKKGADVNQENILNNVDALSLLSQLPSSPLSNYFYSNYGELQFESNANEIGLNQKTFSSGAAYGDLDNDGDLDLVVNNMDEFAFVYKNNSIPGSNNFISFELTTPATLNPIGTTIEVELNDKTLTSQLTNSRGFYSTSQQRLHFGLGNEKTVKSVIVKWSNGSIQELSTYKINQTNTVSHSPSNSSQSEKGIVAVENYAEKVGLDFLHKENEYNDFSRQVLLPHRLSQLGPAIAKSDVNGDGLEDIFVGGSTGNEGQLFLQNAQGGFLKRNANVFIRDKNFEDVDAEFFDADLDGDLDLYVVSGGNEFDLGHKNYQDRLYINNGSGVFKNEAVLPNIFDSGSKVEPQDFDQDGDIDVLVTTRHLPGKYPFPATSRLLINEFKEKGTATFSDATKKIAPSLENLGMVTDATWVDIDQDEDEDLVIVGEWMDIKILINENGELLDKSAEIITTKTNGWWFSVESDDIDGDGDVDLLLGNLGKNYKYKKSETEEFKVFFGDLDKNGISDIVLSEKENGIDYPVRGRSCSSEQMPGIKKKFVNYKSFASASVQDIYGDKIQGDQKYEIDLFESGVMINDGHGNFSFSAFPNSAQISTINDFLPVTVGGEKKYIAATNFYGAEVETPRADAAKGFIFSNNNEEMISKGPQSTGLYLTGQVTNITNIKIKGKDFLLAVPNNSKPLLYPLDQINF